MTDGVPVPDGEVLDDGEGGYFTRHWACEQPPPDVRFIVVQSDWNDDFTVQTVHEIWIP